MPDTERERERKRVAEDKSDVLKGSLPHDVTRDTW